MRSLLVPVGFLLLFSLGAPLAAQVGPVGAFVGLTAGPAAIPQVYSNGCGRRLTDSPPVGSVSGGLHAGARLRPTLSAEVRVGYSRMPETTCLLILENHRDGVHTDRYRASGYERRFLSSDLRLRYEPWAPWVFTGGVGWQWAHADPYLVGGIAWGVGRRVRGIVGADFTSHRVGVRDLTREWRDSDVVRVISEKEDHVWRMGAALRIGVEMDVR